MVYFGEFGPTFQIDTLSYLRGAVEEHCLVIT